MWQLIPGKSLLHGIITIPGAMTQAPGVTPSQKLYGHVPHTQWGCDCVTDLI